MSCKCHVRIYSILSCIQYNIKYFQYIESKPLEHVFWSPMEFTFFSLFMKPKSKLYVVNVMINMYIKKGHLKGFYLPHLQEPEITKKAVWHSETANRLSAMQADGWLCRRPRECNVFIVKGIPSQGMENPQCPSCCLHCTDSSDTILYIDIL